MTIAFSLKPQGEFSLLTFDLGKDPIEPGVLGKLDLPEIPHGPIVVSGRGPVWLFAYICHEVRSAPWVATHDPRLGGGVVVATTTPGVMVGDIVVV
jgi:CRISPR-associated protein Csx3